MTLATTLARSQAHGDTMRLLRTLLVFLTAVAIFGLGAPVRAVSLTDSANVKLRGQPVEFRGDIVGSEDISGVAIVGDLLVIVSDEVKDPTLVHVMKKEGMAYRVIADVEVPADGELDLEAVAADANMVYVTGSHAWTRKIKDGAIYVPQRKKSREQFFRFRLDANGNPGPVEGPKSLRSAIKAHPVLNGFLEIASKENGIDIEGLAVKDGRLYFGFRGPVLRDGWVPILVTTWEDPESADVIYVQLDGRGIRDITAVKDGFLILAGPLGDGDFSYRVYFWNGFDQLSASTGAAKPQRIAEFSDLGDAKPEGLAVLDAQGKKYQVLVVCDGLPKGGATRWRLSRP